MENFKKVRDAYYEKDKPGNLHTLDDQLTDTEADVDVLADVYGFKEIQGSRSGKCLEENLEEMNSLFEKLSEKFEQMERKVGKPWKYKCFNFVKVYALLSFIGCKICQKVLHTWKCKIGLNKQRAMWFVFNVSYYIWDIKS